MSLVGNLEDLSLGDIMQIISLSQKSGVLALKSEAGAGRIVFRAGLVHAACLEGGSDDLRGLLVSSGTIEAATFDAFAAHAEKVGCGVSELLVQKSDLSSEELDGLLRASVEATILEMFAWRSGDFSFDVRSEVDVADPEVVLSAGVNAQYLAMEGMRIRDEQSREDEDGGVDPNAETAPPPSMSSPLDAAESSAAAMFGDEQLELDDVAEAEPIDLEWPDVSAPDLDASADDSDSVTAADVLVATVLAEDDGEDLLDATPLEPEMIEPADSAPVDAIVESDRPSEPAFVERRAGAEVGNSVASSLPLILIDPDVTVLEWARTALEGEFSRVHPFQQADQGLARIRQYLIRGEFPVVLISTDIRIDPLSGIRSLSDFVARLKAQASKLIVLGLAEDPTEDAAADSGRSSDSASARRFDGIVLRPSGRRLRGEVEALAPEAGRDFAVAVRESLGTTSPAAQATPKGSDPDGEMIRHLRNATAKLQEASSRGEVLPVVLDFASEIFARVAILIVREEQVFAIAGRGIGALEVDPLDSSPPVSLQALGRGWIRSVLDSGKSASGPPSTDADRDLLARFGGIEPSVAYLGPIESSGSTIAMLYCDQGDGGGGIPDTSGLEVVLQHAGLALDRAALERALWEVDAEAP